MSEISIDQKEKLILELWDENKIYEKSVKKNKKGKKFYFMDGPPYASGKIHLGTALNKILKDIALRSKRMQGFEVFDRAGYDTHGTPIELQVEKEIGSKSKQDIEKFGVKKFIDRCKEYATEHIDHMNKEFKNLGVWMDFSDPYLTLNDEFIEAIWASLKEADKKNLLYLGKYPVHVCPRCSTAVAFNEIEYGKQKDTSIYVKFPLKKKKNTFLIIWTTTPWTLPANTGVMANPDVDYQEVEVAEGERWIIAKKLVGKIMQELERGFTIKDEFKGKKMLGWEYENPLSKNLKIKVENAYKVVLSNRYVNIEDGTGLVHCAPGHGKEDYEVGKEFGLDAPSPVSIDGFLTSEAGKYYGKRARIVDKEILEDLEKEGYLVYKHEYEHDYPLCWRDKTPLLMISLPQWFLKISQIQKKLLKDHEKIKWIPEYMGARMKAWMEGLGDWPISRQRYWGSPIPIWYNEETGEKVVVGSKEELEKLSGVKVKEMHKPEIDNIVIKGKKGILKRVPEVLDVWFDSGVASWAALGYPKEKKKFEKYWPADLNIEGKDQFRGWWNSQSILSEILFEKLPYKTIGVHGMVLDISKKKLSKSAGNAVAPSDIIRKYGRDYLRYYFAKFSKGDDFAYDENEFREIHKIITILANTNNFVSQIEKSKEKKNIEDVWILSRYNSLIEQVTKLYNEYRFPETVQALERFIVFDLSRGYIQIIRDRAGETYNLLNEIRLGLLKLFSSITPFLTEQMWQELRDKKIVKEESVHLSDWPEADKKKINKELEKEFESALKIIEIGLRERDKVKIGLRWPLLEAVVESKESINEKLKEVIAKQLNVKKVNVKKADSEEIKVVLNTKMNEELEAEGFAREFIRKVQAERKNAGLKKGQLITLEVGSELKIISYFKKQSSAIKEKTNSKELIFSDGETPSNAIVSTIKERKIWFVFRNLKEVLPKKI